MAAEARVEGVDLSLPPGARAAASTDAGPMSLAEQGPAPPPEPTPTPMSFCQGYPEMTPRDRVLHLWHAYKHGMLYHCVLEMGTFREFGNHEDSDVALKTLERTVRRLFLDARQDKLHVRIGPDAEAMSY
eukprot:11168728-Lingulodinium_polyedra.AAC.1